MKLTKTTIPMSCSVPKANLGRIPTKTTLQGLTLMLFLALGLFFYQVPLQAQNYAYSASYQRVSVTRCFDTFFSGSAVFRIYDETDAPGTNSLCYINLNAGQFLGQPFSRSVNDQQYDPLLIKFDWDFFENDRGEKCVFDTDNKPLTNDDDCRYRGTRSFLPSDFGTQQRITLNGPNNWDVDLVYTWNYVEVLKPNIEVNQIAQTPNNCCTELSGFSSTQNNVNWYWQTSSNGTDISNRDSRGGFIVCPDFEGQPSKTVYLRARGNRNGVWSDALEVTVNFPIRLNIDLISSASTVCSGGSPTLTVNTSGPAVNSCNYAWYRSTSGSGGPFSLLEQSSNNTFVPAAIDQSVWYRAFVTCTDATCSDNWSNTVYVKNVQDPALTTTVTGGDNTICFGETVDLKTSINGGIGGCTLQWQQSSSPSGPFTDIPNATGGLYTTNSLTTTTYFRARSLGCGNANFGCDAIPSESVGIFIADLPPVITCPADITINTDQGLCEAVVNYSTPVGTDDCSTPTTILTAGLGSGASFPLGTTIETYTVTDVAGSSTSCSFNVTVVDAELPVALCQPVTVTLDANGSASITAQQVDNGSNDACGGVSLSLSQSNFDCTDNGTASTTLTVTDEKNNSNTCTATITIEDGPTVAVCTTELLVIEVDENGQASITADQLDGGSYASCGLMLSLDQTDFGCSLGTQTVRLTASDGNGGSSSCDALVQVRDNVNPTPICTDITAELDATGQVVVDAGLADNGSTDNCSINDVYWGDLKTTKAFDCGDVNIPISETIIIEDNSGNLGYCSANVTIEDNVAPDAKCQNKTIQLDASGIASITANDIDSGSSDACGIASLSLDESNFSCFHLGDNTVTLTVEDLSNNKATCTATVTVENTNFPNACKVLSKEIFATNETGSSEAGDGSNGSERPVLIGEVITFKLVIDIPEGTGNNIVITDQIPEGLAYVAGTANFNAISDNGITYGTGVSGGSISGADVIFDLGTVTNSDNDANAETIEITFDAVVENEIGNQVGTLLSNQAEISVGGNVLTNSESRTLIVQEPTLSMVVAQRASNAGPFVSEGDAGDEIYYHVSLTNTGNAPAYNVSMVANLPFNFVDLDQCCIFIGGNTGVTANYDDVTGLWTTTWDEIGAGTEKSSIIVVRVANAALASDSWDVTANATYTSVPGTPAEERTGADGIGGALNDYAVSATSPTYSIKTPLAVIQVEHPSQTPISGVFGSSYADSSSDPNTNTNQYSADVEAAIGETFSYLITVTFQEGTTGDFRLSELVRPRPFTDLTGGRQSRVLDILSAEVLYIGANISGNGIRPLGYSFNIEDRNGDGDGDFSRFNGSGNRNVLNLPDGVEDDKDRYIIRVMARMDDEDESGGIADAVGSEVENVDGAVTGNRLQSLWFKSDGSFVVRNSVADIEIVEPDFSLSKMISATDGNGVISAGDLTDAVPGDQVTFSFVLTNNGTAPAYDINLTDNLDPAFDLISVNTSSGTDLSDLASDQVNVSIGSIPIGASVTVTAEVTIRNTVTLGNTYTNTANATAQSQPGSGLDIRNYSASDQAYVTIIDCLVTISNVSVGDESCPGAGDGTVNVTASSTSGNALTYILTKNAEEFTSSDGQFAGLEPGTYTLEVSDASIAGCTTIQNDITILAGVDNTPPTALCQDVIVQLDADGNGSTTAQAADNGSSDACGIASLALSQTSFGCAEVGANAEVLTVTDVNGNESTCDVTVTVEDNVAPEALCQDVIVQLDADGNGSTTAQAADNGSSDACGIASLALSQTSFGCAEVGANAEVLTVTDVNGNESTCDVTVTVEDNVAPEALCQNVTVQLDADGNGSTTAQAADNGSSDACGIASLALSQTSFGCAEVGANAEVLTVTDVNGNESTCDVTVTVEDNVAPEALCQDVIVQLNADGNGSTTAQAADNGSSDACGIASLALSQTSFGCAEVGANAEVLTVTDVNGNESTCDVTVTVEDNVAPEALCQDVIVQLDADGNGSTTAQAADNGSSDACGIASLALSQTSFGCAEVGANAEVLTVTDVNGNESTCDVTVTVEDNVAPEALCQDVIVQLDADGNGSTTAQAADNGSSDACGIASIILSQTSFGCAEVGANAEVLTVTDVNGNESTCDVTVTVEDNVAPEALCQNVTVQLDADGNGSTTAQAADNGSSDACGIASIILSQTSFDCAEVGANAEVLTVTDVNGNESTCDVTVTVEDNVAPEALCQDVIVQLNADGNGSTTAQAADNGSSDACGIASLALSQTSFGCAEVGANAEVLTVTDVNGNESTCGVTVTVEDNVAPEALCQDVIVQLDADGNGSTTAQAADNGSSDACGIASLALSQTSFGCAEVGANAEVLTVTDVNGNESTCDVTVTVEDNVAPEALCQDVIVQLDADGNGSTTAQAADNGSSDACGIASIILSQTSFGCAEVGANEEVLTVTDVNGNESTCDVTVTIEDKVAPKALCQSKTVQLDGAGTARLSIGDIDNGSSDACGIASYALDMEGFNCENIGDNTVTLTLIDVNGNESTCTATVTVEDNIAPVVNCPGDIVVDNDPGDCGAFVEFDVTATDNCEISINLQAGQSSGSVFPEGTTAQQYTITDQGGNEVTCSFTVTVNRSGDPELLSAYTAIGFKEVKMKRNTVESGGVGVVNSGKKAKLEKGTMITSPTGFVKAPKLELKEGSMVTEYYPEQVEESILPEFLSGKACNNDVKISDNQTEILDKACYGKIEVEKNASITFSGHETVKIKEIDLKEGASVFFDQNTNLLIEKQFKGEKELVLSNDGYLVWIFAEEDIDIKENSSVTCNMYSLKEFKAEKRSVLKGLFIGEKIYGKEDVIWNWSDPCSLGSPAPASSLAVKKDQVGQFDLRGQDLTGNTEIEVFPNPFSTEVTIQFNLLETGSANLSVFNLQGKLIDELFNGQLDAGQHQQQWNGADNSSAQMPSGMYLIQLRTDEEIINKKVMLKRD